MGKPVEQIKEFAEKKFRALRENPDESAVKAYLAKMRRGVGKAPGTDPDLWGILFEDLPEELTGTGGIPGRAEMALYTAFTLYAIHQQSHSLQEENAYQRGIGFGRAAGEMAAKEPDALNAVRRRFNAAAVSSDITELVAYERNGTVVQAERDSAGLCAVSSRFLSVSGFRKNPRGTIKVGTRFL